MHAVAPLFVLAIAVPPYSVDSAKSWAVLVFWSWPIWPYLLIKHYREYRMIFIVSMLISVVAIIFLFPVMILMTAVLGGAKT